MLEAMGTHSESPELAVAVVHYLDNMSDADDNKAPLFTAACRVVVELLSSFGSCSSLPWSVRVAVCALALQPVPVPVAVSLFFSLSVSMSVPVSPCACVCVCVRRTGANLSMVPPIPQHLAHGLQAATSAWPSTVSTSL